MAAEIAAYNEFRAQLGELQAHNKTLVFNYEDPKGNQEARSHIYKLRQMKSAVDKARKAEKEQSLEYGRQVDGQAKTIVEQIESMIDVHQKPLDEIEAKEQQRIQAHQQTIAAIQAVVALVPGAPDKDAALLRVELDALEVMDLGDMQEFAEEALRCKDDALRILRDRYAKRVKYEAEQAELVELRVKAEAQTKKDNEDRIAKEAAERATREAEVKAAREKQEAADKAKREKDASDKKLLEEKLRNERLEREKAEAEQRAKDAARETEERIKREADAKAKKDAEDLAKREADKKHRASINDAAVSAFVAHKMPKAEAEAVVDMIAKKLIPHIIINY